MESRRSFLKNSSLLSISLFFPINFGLLTDFNLSNKILAPSLDELLKNAADYRKSRNFSNAKNIYYDIIRDFPEEIRAYDGLRKTILIDPNGNYEDWLNLLMKANKGFQNNPDFRERLAKEYMNVALGNNVFVKKIFKRDTLLEEAGKILNSLRTSYPSVQQYQEQYEKTQRKISQNADVVDARDNPSLKTYKKIQRNLYRERFDKLSIIELKNKLTALLNLPQNNNRDKHAKELIRLIVGKYEALGQNNNAFLFIYDILNFNYPNDSNFKATAKSLAKKINNYNGLINVCSNFPEEKNSSFWNKLCLFDAHLYKLEKTGSGNINTINTRLQNLILEASNIREHLELNYRAVKFNVLANRLNDAQNALISFGNLFKGSGNAHVFILYTQALKMYHDKSGTSYMASKFINYALGNEDLNFPYSDELTEINKEILLSVTIEKPFHIARLNSLLAT